MKICEKDGTFEYLSALKALTYGKKERKQRC